MESIKQFFKKFFWINLVFGIGMMVGSAIGTSVTLGMYGTPDITLEQLNCQCAKAMEAGND